MRLRASCSPMLRFAEFKTRFREQLPTAPAPSRWRMSVTSARLRCPLGIDTSAFWNQLRYWLHHHCLRGGGSVGGTDRVGESFGRRIGRHLKTEKMRGAAVTLWLESHLSPRLTRLTALPRVEIFNQFEIFLPLTVITGCSRLAEEVQRSTYGTGYRASLIVRHCNAGR